MNGFHCCIFFIWWQDRGAGEVKTVTFKISGTLSRLADMVLMNTSKIWREVEWIRMPKCSGKEKMSKKLNRSLPRLYEILGKAFCELDPIKAHHVP